MLVRALWTWCYSGVRDLSEWLFRLGLAWSPSSILGRMSYTALSGGAPNLRSGSSRCEHLLHSCSYCSPKHSWYLWCLASRCEFNVTFLTFFLAFPDMSICRSCCCLALLPARIRPSCHVMSWHHASHDVIRSVMACYAVQLHLALHDPHDKCWRG